MPEDPLFFENRVRDSITTLRLIAPPVLARERARAHSKWFAYRFMSPLEATVHFADLYRQAFKRYIAVHRDINDAENANGLGSRIFGAPNSSLTEVWNARQRADELGLPYNLLIEFGFHFAGRRARKRAPRPGQLFDSGKANIAWPLELEKWIMDPLHYEVQRLDMPEYQHENYRSFPAQTHFHDYLLECLAERHGAWGPKLAHHCLSRRHLPVNKAIKIVPKSARASVVRHFRDELEQSFGQTESTVTLPDLALAPACFGLPYAADENSPECDACPLTGQCAKAAGNAATHMLDRFGSVSPHYEQRNKIKAENGALRTRRFRANKKLKETEASQQPEVIKM